MVTCVGRKGGAQGRGSSVQGSVRDTSLEEAEMILLHLPDIV